MTGFFIFSGTAYAPWIWTPETKKFINPKNAVKDSPKEQFEWAMNFYNAKDYQRAAFEFNKLAKQYEFSDYASKSQYYVGLCYENMQKYYTAFENYQKAIDNFPHLANTDEVLARQYAIGLIYLEKPGAKVLGNDIMAPLDRAVEIFKKVVENAPYGKYAEEAQFKLGEALKKSLRYDEAVQAYHKIVEDYSNSKFATKAMFEESYCAYRASLKPAYDASTTDNAIKTFEKFIDKNKDTGLANEAEKTMKRLKDNVAEKSFETARFYESQGRREAAIIYYQDVIDTYPDSSFAKTAKEKIDELKNPPAKKAPAPFYVDKKNPKQAAREPARRRSWTPFGSKGTGKEDTKKQFWNLFGFGGKKTGGKGLAGTAVQKEMPVPAIGAPKAESANVEQPAPITESPLAEPAKPIPDALEPAPKAESADQMAVSPKVEPVPQVVETPKAEPAPPTEEAAKQEEVSAQAKEAPNKKSWKPLNFSTKKEPAAKVITEKKPWKPFNFENKNPSAAKEEAAKKKTWKPFSFKPLNFDTKKTEDAKGWTPLNFNKK